MPKPKRLRPPYKAMIVAAQPEATEAGLDMLSNGGNALDAVIACALTQGVVDPMMCGVGALGSLNLYDPASGGNLILDGLSTCPAASTPHMWEKLFLRECSDGYGYVLEGGVNELGHAAVTTPGIMRVFGKAHAQFGKLPWAELYGPAIGHAEGGWVVRPHVSTMFNLDESAYGRLPMAAKLALTPDGRTLYLRPDGTPKRVGEEVRNRDLAATLRYLAREGAKSFYTGEIARRIVDDMREHGGPMTLEDLANFKVESRKPLRTPYRGRMVATPPPPGGGIMVAEMLRIVEHFELTKLEHNGPEYIRVLAEAMKIAGADKERHIGDPAFVTAPLDRLLSDAYASECAERIGRGEKTKLTRLTSDSKDTTTVSCVDRNGMVVSLTHTNGAPSGVIPPGTGFMLNGGMNWYDPRPGRPGSIAPGKRRFSSMTPSIVFEGEKPVMTLGAPGGAWIGIAILQVLVNVLDWGMLPSEAVAAPRFSATSDAIDISNRIPRRTQRALEAMGYEVRRSPATFPFAAPHALTMWDGELEGGADPQRDGYAAGLP
jgi:gamma-glutamyltranspeptidase/glutathione hydrolase